MKLGIIDAGKFQTKGKGDKKTLFKTRIVELPKYDPDYENILELEGKFYAIGEGEIASTGTSKMELTHRICTLFALTKIFDDIHFREDIYLVLGSPITMFENPQHKADFKNFIMGEDEGLISFKVNQKQYLINIQDVLILPESSGVVYTQPELFKNKIVGVIDWGGLQINCMIYDNGKPIKSTGFTRQLGSYTLEADLVNKLNGLGRNYQEYELHYVIARPDFEERHIVETVINTQLSKIFSECEKNNWNINKIDLVFTGGTSLRFEHILREKNYTVSENALNDNIDGFERVAQVWLSKLLNQ